jgi:hypothetical protein
MRIRQIALVAEKLEPVAEQLQTLFGLGAPFRDEGIVEFGLDNAVFAVGDTFLEVVSPIRAGTTAGRLLERRAGDGGYMVILQTDDLAADRARLDALGVRVVWQIAMDDIETVHLHPRDVGGAILSIDIAHPPESWRWGGPDWPTQPASKTALRIDGAEIQSGDPDAMARRWSEVIDQPLAARSDGACEIPLEGGSLRFVDDRDGRGDGVAALGLSVRDPKRVLDAAVSMGLAVDRDTVTLCGTRFSLHEG